MPGTQASVSFSSGTASPSSTITAIGVVIGTVSPAVTRIRARMPEAGDSTSWIALSDSISTISSPASTRSPSAFSHDPTVPSCIVMPHLGIGISVAMR